MTGQRLGQYEVLSKLGEGGMGEVYRARDTKLGRDVAIKVVLEAFVADRERLARFEREARALAALNHPGIATLHGMEESGGRHFLVMELVPGQTLGELIDRRHPEAESASSKLREGASAAGRGGGAPRGLKIEDALPIATQIAEALEAAHEKGIVHRDLKPANVKITPDDKVKILDFGLAKAGDDRDASMPSASLANSPTLTATGTQAGMILGTASYMSPEQARGQSGDHRSDVFSFGVVLYEMLTGRQPFQGETVSDVLASVLARDPDVSALPQNLPPRLTELVKRCLEKQPKRRWQAIGDVRHELEMIAANPQAQAAAVAPPPAATVSSVRRVLPVALAAALVSAAITAGVFFAMRPAAPPAPARTSFSFEYPQGKTRTGAIRQAMAVSPDGARVAFVADRDVYIRELAELEPRKLNRGVPNNSSAPMNLAFSPDGKSVAYWDLGDDTIYRIDIAGGPPARVTSSRNPNGMTWYGDSLYYTQQGSILRVSASGGDPETLVKNDPSLFQTAPHVLPDGSLLYSVAPGGEGTDRWVFAEIVLLRPGATTPTVIFKGGSDPRYLASGHLLYQAEGRLFARTFNFQSGAAGPATAVVNGVMRGSSSLGAGLTWYGVATNGTLVYMPGPVGAAELDLRLGWFDREGKAEWLPMPGGPYGHPRLSPDGKQIAFNRIDNGQYSIFIYNLAAGGSPRRLTFGGRERFPIWSSDSQWVIFSQAGDDGGLFRQRADGSGTAERLTTSAKDGSHAPASASPDGAAMLFHDTREDRSELMLYAFKDRTSSPVTGGKSTINAGAAFSPDGKWIVYSIREQGTATLVPFVQPYPLTGARYQIYNAREGGHTPVWSPDGQELFITPGPGQALNTVKVTTSPSFTFAPGEVLARPFLNTPPTIGRPFDVARTPTGVRFLALARSSGVSRDEFRVVLNWVEELKGKVK